MAKKRAAKKRPVKKIAKKIQINAKKRQVKRKKRRSTIVKAVKKFIGMD